MSCTHVGGYAGKRGTHEMQVRIGKLRRRVTELEELHVRDKDYNRRLRAENKALRELVRRLDAAIALAYITQEPPTSADVMIAHAEVDDG